MLEHFSLTKIEFVFGSLNFFCYMQIFFHQQSSTCLVFIKQTNSSGELNTRFFLRVEASKLVFIMSLTMEYQMSIKIKKEKKHFFNFFLFETFSSDSLFTCKENMQCKQKIDEDSSRSTWYLHGR